MGKIDILNLDILFGKHDFYAEKSPNGNQHRICHKQTRDENYIPNTFNISIKSLHSHQYKNSKIEINFKHKEK